MDRFDRPQWLRDRQTGIGATDVASLAGVGFATPEEVYADKLAPEPADRPPSGLMAMGLALEAHNAELYTRRTGRHLFAPGLLRVVGTPWVYATLDRVSLDRGDEYGGPVELKYAAVFGEDWGDDGTDQVRDGYTVQATWQTLVLRMRGHDVRSADVSAVDGFGHHRVYTVPFDDRLAELLLSLASTFWDRVATRAGLDGWNPAARAAIESRLATIHPDTTVALGRDALELVDEYEARRAAAREHGDAADRVKSRLVAMLGTNEVGTLPDGRRVRQKTLARKAYAVEAGSYVRFDVLKPKKGKVERE